MPVMKQFVNPEIMKPEKIKVATLIGGPAELYAADGNTGLDNEISDKHLHRPQLALAGFTDLFTFKRVQLFGNTEMYYLNSLPEEKRIEAFGTLLQFPVPCIVVTSEHRLQDSLVAMASAKGIPILYTDYETIDAYGKISQFLNDQFAEQMSVHASFVDIYGVGILFVGKSGVGKSEIALDLVERGHRLVADDIVVLTKRQENVVMGTGTDTIGHFMEIRGLGIIDITRMFGLRSIRYQKRLEIIVELETWKDKSEYTRTGLDSKPIKVMGTDIHYVKLPIIPGKNITVISEVIALNYLLKTYGYSAAEAFQERLQNKIAENKSKYNSSIINDVRMVKYFLDNE